MTNEQAIEYFERIKKGEIYLIHQNKMADTDYELCDMAIQALEKQRWIPVGEKLPEIGNIEDYWVCTDKGYMCKAEWISWHWNYYNIPIGEKIIAWRELPEPYREEVSE